MGKAVAASEFDVPGDGVELSVRERILVHAKELIARKGPIATTVRDISEASETNVAAVNYYFGSKDALMREVLIAVLEPPNVRRSEMLERARQVYGPMPLPLHAILEALVRPLVESERAADGGRLFVRAEQHLRAAPDSEYTRFVAAHFDPYAQMFLDEILRTLPHLSRPEVVWRYEFARGAALHLLANCDPLSGKLSMLADGHGMVDVDDNELVLEEILANVMSGIASPPAWRPEQIRKKGRK